MLLQVENLHVAYGAIRALRGISFHIEPGEVVTLIGANGAGKSTTLRTISGLLRPSEGDVLYQGESLIRTPAERIVSMGICHVPEGRHIFGRLTVKENLEMGAYTRSDPKEISESLERVFASFPRLKASGPRAARSLAANSRCSLWVGADVSASTLLLLDEPSVRPAPIVSSRRFSRSFVGSTPRARGILLVEQNAAMALSVAHRGYVLETGSVVLEGTPPSWRATHGYQPRISGTRSSWADRIL